LPSRARKLPSGAVVTSALLALLLALTTGASPAAAGYATLPVEDGRAVLGNLTGAELSPGGAGSIGFTVENPLTSDLVGTTVTLDVYAFNAFPGNATSTVPVSAAPVLSNATASGAEVNLSLGAVLPGRVVSGSVSVTSSASTPSGTFAVRTAVRFSENGTEYLFESRGWFTAATWATATTGPNGTVILNLTALGVSGVVPETSVLVSSSAFATALWALFGVGLVVVAVGGYLALRPSKSRSGTTPSDGETQAPSARGNSRTSDGD
jgi:hypothetical protein